MIKVHARNYSEQDREHFTACLAHHQDRDAKRWTDGGLQVFYDEDGNRLYLKVERLVRVHILTDPSVTRQASANLIAQSGQQVKATIKNLGYKGIIFESRAKRLIKFTEKWLGFKRVKDNYLAEV